MSGDTTTGVPHPDRPGRWLVPPWPAGAHFRDVVRHFLRFRPWHTTNLEHLRAYYVAYRAALDSAPTTEPRDAAAARWYKDMRDVVARCAQLYQHA